MSAVEIEELSDDASSLYFLGLVFFFPPEKIIKSNSSNIAHNQSCQTLDKGHSSLGKATGVFFSVSLGAFS